MLKPGANLELVQRAVGPNFELIPEWEVRMYIGDILNRKDCFVRLSSAFSTFESAKKFYDIVDAGLTAEGRLRESTFRNEQ